jgi:hypothetical protein
MSYSSPSRRRIKNTYKVNKLYKSGEYNLLLPVPDYAPFVNAVDIRQQTKKLPGESSESGGQAGNS